MCHKLVHYVAGVIQGVSVAHGAGVLLQCVQSTAHSRIDRVPHLPPPPLLCDALDVLPRLWEGQDAVPGQQFAGEGAGWCGASQGCIGLVLHVLEQLCPLIHL